MRKGIDISKWQNNIDFGKVKNTDVEFVILRSSYRQTVDPKFFEYVEGCKKNNITIFGIYHFIYALNDEQALAEAKFCIEQLKKAGLSDDIMVFSDFEYDTINKAAQSGVTLTKNECNRFTEFFCEYVSSQGYKTGIYCNNDFHKNWYNKDLFNKYPLWLADYSGEPDHKCLVHQYTNSGIVNGINGKVDMNYLYEDDNGDDNMPKTKSRQAVVDLILSWEGRKESNGSHKYIIDIYNSLGASNLPRKILMEYNWSWCACTWSALAIKLGFTDIMPIEISCGKLIEAAKKMGCWQESDKYVGKPADAVLYDWDDKTGSIKDNTGWPDHIGTIIETNKDAGYFVVMEGNYDDSVKKRTLSINGKYIRGFITPKYENDDVSKPELKPGKDVKTIAHEVIAGTWGSGEARKKALEKAGYNYREVQDMVNKILNGEADKPATKPQPPQITATCSAKKFNKSLAGSYKTTANLYLRNDAGTNKKALCLIPKDTQVNCYGYYTDFNGTKWLYIQAVVNNILYTGFSSAKYLKG